MTKNEKRIISQLRKNIRKKTQKCYTPKCSNNAIRSHLIQKNGVLKSISTDKKVIEIEYLDLRFDNKLYRFREVGIIGQKSESLNFWGFCNNCDTIVFKKIESENVDYSDYKTQLLFCYRAFLNEHNKQEYNIKWHESIFKSKELSNEIKNIYKPLHLNQLLTTRIGKYVKKKFESDIENDTHNFEFIHFTLPKINICTSAIFSYPIPQIIKKEDLNNSSEIKPKNNINFINLIPDNENLNVIIGILNHNDLKGGLDLKTIQTLNNEQKLKFISDVLIKHIESWFISPELYELWKTNKLDQKILENIRLYHPLQKKFENLEFNIFSI